MSQENPKALFSQIRELIADDLARVDRCILDELRSDVVLINQIGHHLIRSGGKRLRPLLLLLSARALDYRGEDHITLAAVVELIHSATLLHDDVVDGSDLRRGQKTANAIWGNAASVLVGDFLYATSFRMMVRVGKMRVIEVMAETTSAIAEGEVLQLLNTHNPSATEERYLQVIWRKTAILFSAAARLPAILADAPEEIEKALAEYGLRLGIAFQLVDDILDYRADPEALGKSLGDDLAEGKPTLPLIYAMAHAQPKEADLLRKALAEGNRQALDRILPIIEATGAIAYTKKRAREEAERAVELLTDLPESPYRKALEGLARFSVARTF